MKKKIVLMLMLALSGVVMAAPGAYAAGGFVSRTGPTDPSTPNTSEGGK